MDVSPRLYLFLFLFWEHICHLSFCHYESFVLARQDALSFDVFYVTAGTWGLLHTNIDSCFLWPSLRNIYGGVGEQIKPYLANIIKVKLKPMDSGWSASHVYVFFGRVTAGFMFSFLLS